jgi:hypothetical protein
VHRYFLVFILRTSLALAMMDFSCVAKAQEDHPEVVRTEGFKEYKRQKKFIEEEREKGLSLHLERQEIERREYDEALKEYRKEKAKEKPPELTPLYKEYLASKDEDQRQNQADLEEFREDKKAQNRELKIVHLDPMEELGLPEDRPRYDIKKRALYGATTKHFGRVSGAGVPDSGSSGGSGGSSNFTPPSSGFDEFPPPSSGGFPEDNFDVPPPPPPPMPFDDGGTSFNTPFEDFPPPPPPPPDDNFNF